MALRPAIAYFPPRGNRRVSNPALEPVTADSFRAYVKADAGTVSDEEALLYISQAREFIEELSGIAMIQQVWLLTLDRWPGYVEQWWDGVREMATTELESGTPRVLGFPRYPLISVSSVKVYDEESVETTVNLAQTFDVDTDSRPGRFALKRGRVWPTATRSVNAIMIEYIAGFGADATAVPAGLSIGANVTCGRRIKNQGRRLW